MRMRSDDFEQISDDSRLARGPKELDDRLQIAFVGAPPPAAEPETPAFAFGCLNNRFNWGGDHPLPVRLRLSFFSLLLPFSPPDFPKAAERLVRGCFQEAVDVLHREAFGGEADETFIVPFPFTTCQKPPPHPRREQESLLAV